ncbi:hypothetical protein EDC01DRAFT_141304 [Geopyxis carbonaria]|nr:hypothetical protein EDC01DRAFT_141304 [Geopyxis carbonaria]
MLMPPIERPFLSPSLSLPGLCLSLSPSLLNVRQWASTYSNASSRAPASFHSRHHINQHWMTGNYCLLVSSMCIYLSVHRRSMYPFKLADHSHRRGHLLSRSTLLTVLPTALVFLTLHGWHAPIIRNIYQPY